MAVGGFGGFGAFDAVMNRSGRRSAIRAELGIGMFRTLLSELISDVIESLLPVVGKRQDQPKDCKAIRKFDSNLS